ncbi:hypothetical protein BDV95DRAFT_592586 [Massariosphaeria phaeospora]|uniref:Uncharacterized protein n=1 Tax=Massariosphaeria phaeospora TaxID=100035 RepID=A0A7C8MQC1_9PLEO|nr:hypothetical protein BDV95DRAFT_592586 [Massariosphaeria phaeospora]
MLRRALPPALTLFLLASCASAAPYDLDFLKNYRNSAPAPEDGPPASFHASRDKALLPGQICGIVGGYVATVLIWGILLLTVGRRMRRKTENSPKTLELELVTARPPSKTPASPHSARSATSWFKKGFKKNDSAVTSPSSPVVQSPGSFDQRIIDADKERAQADMERLYAAVMDHDARKSKSNSLISTEESARHDRRPSNIDTSQHVQTHSNPNSPMRPIYPPGYHNGPTTAPLPHDRLQNDQPPASPRSILSKKSHHSATSTNSKTRFNLKNLRISGPIHKYPSEPVDSEARTPLSPRFYNPGAPPSPPTQQNSPTATTPGNPEEAYEQLDAVQPLPRPAPQRSGSTSQPHPYSQTPPPGSNPTLPLRGYAEPLKSPDLRTTTLERRLDKLSLTTPKTGVPYTPYSPYMPFTPVTPVTPHLITKKERKMKSRLGGKKAVGRDDMVQSPKDMFGDAW